MPTFAVLLAAYNGAEWILEQIDSILSQEGVDLMLYISIDYSTDETLQLVLSRVKTDTRIVVLPYGQRFGGAAANFFRLTQEVEVDNFDFVALSDQDDIWLRDKLFSASQYLLTGGYDAYSSNVTAFWPDGKTVLIKKSHSQRLYDHFYEAAGPGCTYVFKMGVFISIKDFLSKNSENCANVALHDWLFYAYCRHSGFSWFIDSKPSMLYRQHCNNQVGTNTNLLAYFKRLRMIKAGWYRRQVTVIAMLVAPDFAERLSSRVFIITHFFELRRRVRDRVFLLIMAITRVF